MKQRRARTFGPEEAITWETFTKRLARYIVKLDRAVSRVAPELSEVSRWRKELDSLRGAGGSRTRTKRAQRDR